MNAQLSRDQSPKQFAEKLLEPGEGKFVIDEEEYFYVPALALQATILSCTRQKGRKDSDGRVQDVR